MHSEHCFCSGNGGAAVVENRLNHIAYFHTPKPHRTQSFEKRCFFSSANAERAKLPNEESYNRPAHLAQSLGCMKPNLQRLIGLSVVNSIKKTRYTICVHLIT